MIWKGSEGSIIQRLHGKTQKRKQSNREFSFPSPSLFFYCVIVCAKITWRRNTSCSSLGKNGFIPADLKCCLSVGRVLPTALWTSLDTLSRAARPRFTSLSTPVSITREMLRAIRCTSGNCKRERSRRILWECHHMMYICINTDTRNATKINTNNQNGTNANNQRYESQTKDELRWAMQRELHICRYLTLRM